MKNPDMSEDRRTRLGLAVQLAIIISVAMLPLGLISVYQTSRVLVEKRAVSDAALLERTQRAAADSRELIRSAVSSAEALAASAVVLYTQDDACDAVFAEVVGAENEFVFAGFVNRELQLTCASDGSRRDLSDVTSLSRELSSRKTEIQVKPEEFFGGATALSVSAPVLKDGAFFGTIWIAVPIKVANEMLADIGERVDVSVFDADGEIIMTDGFADDRRAILPNSYGLVDLATAGRNVFRDENRAGELRDFAIVPILDSQVFIMGSWPVDGKWSAFSRRSNFFAIVFPVLMWIAALAVAYVGIHRLVLRHIKRLRLWMLQYAAGRKDFSGNQLVNAPAEIETVAQAFRTMTHRLSEHEKLREEDLEEISTLFKEVHHRVKNNLQLITSIMNMQIRKTDSTEAKNLLRRVQDRVMALSAIHRYLYMARKLSMVQADELLEDIIRQLVVVGEIDGLGRQIRFSTEFDPVVINPDQSVPLSLLATEAAMNAVKYCGADKDGRAWIDIALKKQDADTVTLTVVNSLSDDGATPENPDDADGFSGSGLGSKLIESFVNQLDGQLEVITLPQRFELHVSFELKEFDEESD